MTTETTTTTPTTTTTETTTPASTTSAADRLPDDHPVVKALAKANKEAETARVALKAIEDRDKSELQKAQDAIAERDAKLADLPKAIRGQVLRFASAAARKGFVDPEDALVFIDADLSDAKAVDAALDDLAQRKPHLVKAGQKPKLPGRPKPGGGGGDGTTEGDPNDLGSLKGKERAAAALRQFKR